MNAQWEFYIHGWKYVPRASSSASCLEAGGSSEVGISQEQFFKPPEMDKETVDAYRSVYTGRGAID